MLTRLLGPFTALCLLAVSAAAQARSNYPFAQWARAHAVRLGDLHAATTTDLRPLAQIVADARVVALGEPTHGAEEPLAFRNRLFRYLVETLGFTAIAIESSLPDSRRVDAHVNGAAGNAYEVAHKYIGYGFGEFRATVQLLEWMRAYNANPAHTRKLHFYGIDLPLGGRVGLTPRPLAFEDALGLLARADSQQSAQLRSRLAPLLRLTEDSSFSASAAELDAFTVVTDELVSRLERARPILAFLPKDDYEWGYRSAIVAHQTMRTQRGSPKAAMWEIPPGAWEGVETRDAGMADNVRWVVAREGPQGRVLVFAHNLRVANTRNTGSVWNAFARPPQMMGVHLRSTYGRSLLIIGQSGGASGGSLRKSVEDSSGIDEALGSTGLRHFAVDLRAARVGTAERLWLDATHPLRANLTMHAIVRPIDAFDVLVYVDTLRPAVMARTTP